jgi:hypothetical protein
MSPKRTLEMKETFDMRTLGQMFIGIGTGYAFLRQVTFIANAIFVGASISLIMSGVYAESSTLVEYFGGLLAFAMTSFGISLLISSVIGCLGACYDSQRAIKIFAGVNFLLVICEILVMYVLITTNFTRLFKKAWRRNSSEIEQKWKCVGYDDCKGEANERARDYRTQMIMLASALVVYQIAMMIAAAFYINGLSKKLYQIKQITGVSSPKPSMSSMRSVFPRFFRGQGTETELSQGLRMVPLSTTLDEKEVRAITKRGRSLKAVR